MSHACATVCIQVPTREIICPLKKSLKLRCRSARKVPAARPCTPAPGVGALSDCESIVVGGESAISRETAFHCSARPALTRSTHIKFSTVSAAAAPNLETDVVEFFPNAHLRPGDRSNRLLSRPPADAAGAPSHLR